jgi:hypothetical protein
MGDGGSSLAPMRGARRDARVDVLCCLGEVGDSRLPYEGNAQRSRGPDVANA